MGTPFSRRRVGRRSTPEALPESPRFNFTRDVVEANAAADRYRVALAAVAAEGVIDRRTFSEVAGEAARWAALLRTRNLTPGDRAIVQLPASPGWCSAILGLLKAGFVVVPCSMHDDDEELLRRATDSGAQLIIARKEHVSHDVVGAFPVAVLVEQVAAELRAHAGRQPTEDTREEDAAFVFYTAGTTGDPLGAVHTHGNIRAAMAQANDWLETGRDDVVSCVWDSGWPGAIWDLLGAWASGARIVVHERIRDLDVDERLEMLHRLGVTVLSQTPVEYAAIVEDLGPARLYVPTLRRVLSSGASLDRELIESLPGGVRPHDPRRLPAGREPRPRREHGRGRGQGRIDRPSAPR